MTIKYVVISRSKSTGLLVNTFGIHDTIEDATKELRHLDIIPGRYYEIEAIYE